MLKKILICMIFLCLCVGSVSAHSIIDDEFKIPNGYVMEDVGDWYTNGKGCEIGIQEFEFNKERHYNMLSSSDNYKVNDLGNNTFTSISNGTDYNVVYAFEFVEFNGTKYYIEVTQFNSTSDSDINTCYDTLMEFNKLNKLEPITPPLEED